jgi:hypothetical protein
MAGLKPGLPDMPDTHDRTQDAPIDVQRVLMDRARRDAERHGDRPARPLLPRVVGLALAVLVVGIVLFAFDRFLASMQRFLGLPVVDPANAPSETIPAYVVPLENADEDAGTGHTEASQGQESSPDNAPSQPDAQ